MAMTQPEPVRISGSLQAPPAEPAPQPGRAATETVSGPARFSSTPAYFSEALEDSERLLKYAAEFGISVDDTVRDRILHARAVGVENWDEAIASSVLSGLSKLASQLRPITAESIRACCADGTMPTVRTYWIVAVCLAAVIVPFSLASFVATAISTTVKTDVGIANDLAVKLRAQLGPVTTASQAAPPKASNQTSDAMVIGQLQQYAAEIRAIDSRARQLNALVLFAERDPFANIRNNPAELHKKFQLPADLPDFARAADERTTVYQDVRYFAQLVLDDVSFFYGAITACVLPVLYALLGTCAYLLRSFEQQMATKTFTPSVANSARFLIAGIGGGVVGLFNNFVIGQGASIPPLAIAFLVGYAVDVFFAFLETMLQTFSKTATSAKT